MSKPLLVLDTNVVLDLLHFEDGIARPILEALNSQQVVSVVTQATLEEFRRVLAYPEFRLAPASQTTLFDRYQRLARLFDMASASVELPTCSDPDDQKFLELAATSRACMLVSKDRALLKLRRRCAPHFQIMTPAGAVRWLEDLNANSVVEI
ncbi:MAG TPA: putative toxin-antitoxin system toxin component, PIN family [Thiobacillus sp.]